jgi:hypothetical protein
MSNLPIDVAVPDTAPAPAFEVPTMNHVARRKLGELLADGHQVCGVMIARQNADGTETRGAVSAGGLVIWWHPEQAQQAPVAQDYISHPATIEEFTKKWGPAETHGAYAAWQRDIATVESLRAQLADRFEHLRNQSAALIAELWREVKDRSTWEEDLMSMGELQETLEAFGFEDPGHQPAQVESLRAQLAARVPAEKLTPVIQWLEAGCDPKHAAHSWAPSWPKCMQSLMTQPSL